MDRVAHAFRELQLRVLMLERRGMAFQNLFADIMELCHPNDFQRVCPWGNLGDRKCDGFRTSDKTLFAVYAPDPTEIVKMAEWLPKLDDDFRGAHQYWGKQYAKWCFVHNRDEGLPADILSKLNDLQAEFPQLCVMRIGPPELRRAALSLTDSELTTLLGPAVSSQDLAGVTFEHVKVVVDAVAQQPPVSPELLRPVPAEKIEANALSNGVATLLKAGMERADVVARFFAKWHDPTLGDRVAQGFRDKYKALRSTGLPPTTIYQELWAFAGGRVRSEPDHEAAVLAVLAHLFESCDIFERPSEGSE